MNVLVRWWRRWRTYRAAVKARRDLARLGRIDRRTMYDIRAGKHDRHH